MDKIDKDKMRGSMVLWKMIDKINELVDKVNELEEKING